MRLIPRLFAFVFVSMVLASCEFKCTVGNSSEKDPKTKPVAKDGTLLYNGIQLEANKVEVDKAYLVTNNESPERVEEGNFVEIKEGVKLILLIKNGWKEINGKVWLGATMKVTADNGDVLLEKPDMFESYNETGMTAEDSKALGFSVFFSSWEATRPVTLTVTFRVWDKKSDASVDGSYTIHTK